MGLIYKRVLRFIFANSQKIHFTLHGKGFAGFGYLRTIFAQAPQIFPLQPTGERISRLRGSSRISSHFARPPGLGHDAPAKKCEVATIARL